MYLLQAKLDFWSKFFTYIVWWKLCALTSNHSIRNPQNYKNIHVHIGTIKISCLSILSLESYSPLSTNDLSWSLKNLSILSWRSRHHLSILFWVEGPWSTASVGFSKSPCFSLRKQWIVAMTSVSVPLSTLRVHGKTNRKTQTPKIR